MKTGYMEGRTKGYVGGKKEDKLKKNVYSVYKWR